MSLFNAKAPSTGSLFLRTGFAIFFLVQILQPQAAHAAPITLQATTLTSNGCGVTLSGANFSFADVSTEGACGGRLSPVGIPAYPLPGQQVPFGTTFLTGSVLVPENPSRLAVAYGGGQPSLYMNVSPPTVPADFTGTVLVNVVLTGTVQVCLEPAGVQTPGQLQACDPSYLDFATININVAGLAQFRYFSGFSGARDFLGYTGTAAAAPEPSSASLVAGVGLFSFIMLARRKRLSAKHKKSSI